MLSGPMFEKSESELDKSVHKKEGAHYNIFCLKNDENGMEYIKLFFPEGECDEMNLIFFSTSGIHGSYVTIEDIEKSLEKYGYESLKCEKSSEEDDYFDPFLKKLRDSCSLYSSKIGSEL